MAINIKITNGIDTVTTIDRPKFNIYPQDVATTAQMASGKTVQDLIGYKYVLTIPPALFKAEELQKLYRMRYSNKPVKITFPSILGDITREFIISLSGYEPGNYNDRGVTVWKPPTITATQVDVER